MGKETSIPSVYEETLEKIDIEAGSVYPLGLRCLADVEKDVALSFHRAQECGCRACWKSFWNYTQEWKDLRELDRARERWAESDPLLDIEKYSPDDSEGVI